MTAQRAFDPAVARGLELVVDLFFDPLGQLAQRVPSWGSWQDLVLPPDSIQKLRSIVDQVRHRDQLFVNWGLSAKVSSWPLRIYCSYSYSVGCGMTARTNCVADSKRIPV